MEKFEYKVVNLPLVVWRIFKEDIPANLRDTLNAERANGRRLANSVVTATSFGDSISWFVFSCRKRNRMELIDMKFLICEK